MAVLRQLRRSHPRAEAVGLVEVELRLLLKGLVEDFDLASENGGNCEVTEKDKITNFQLTISQMINVKDETGFSKRIAARQISIADDGFASIIGIGRIPLAGLTQFEAEDLLYERLVMEEINPEFEL